MKWKALLPAVALMGLLLPQQAWSRNHHLFGLGGNSTTSAATSAASSLAGGLGHSTSGILGVGQHALTNNPITNTHTGILGSGLLGIGHNSLIGNTSNGILPKKRRRGIIAFLERLFHLNNNNNNFGNFKNTNNYQFGGLFHNNTTSFGNGGVKGLFGRI